MTAKGIFYYSAFAVALLATIFFAKTNYPTSLNSGHHLQKTPLPTETEKPESSSNFFHPNAMATKFVARNILKHFLAREQAEGAGAVVRRSIGTIKARNFSPFLLLDHFYIGKDGGFPDHPHRGQETVTYMLKGYVDHEDFTGSAGTIGPGDLQFMTAGKGVVHAEMPRAPEDGELAEGMQLWVDLPKELKHCEPRYRDLWSTEIPVAKPNDKVEVKVISGKAYGIDSVKDLAYTPLWYLDYTVKPGGSIQQELPKDHNAFLYLIDGTVEINGETIPTYHNVLFEQNGDGVNVSTSESADGDARFLLVSGQIQHQPIVQNGPFVETSRELIHQAFMDYQQGKNGFERALNWKSNIAKKFRR